MSNKRHVQTFYPDAHTEKIYTEMFPEQRLNFNGSDPVSLDVSFMPSPSVVYSYIVCLDRVNYVLNRDNEFSNDLLDLSFYGGQAHLSVSSAGTHTVGITACEEVVQNLEGKYMPEGTPYVARGGLLYELNYDGNPDGKATAAFLNAQAVKISDLTPDEDELMGATAVSYDLGVGESREKVITVNDLNGDGGAVALTTESNNVCAIVVYEAGLYINGTYTEPGFYVRDFEGIQYTKAIYNTATQIQPVDPRCIVLTAPNGKRFNLAVANDGALSAVEI